MVKCPDPSCREDLIKLVNEKTKNARDCISKKVSTKTLCWAVGILITCMAIVSSISYTAYSRGQDEKQTKIDECARITQKLSTSVAVMQKDIETIKEELKKQGKSQEQILDLLKDLIKRKYDDE